MTGAGPPQRLQRDDPESFRGFNPLLVPQRFRDPVTREAIKAAALLAVYDAAAERAPGQAEPHWLAHRMQERSEFTTAVRQWTARSELVDPQLKTVLDSVVRRADHPLYSQLQDHFAERGLSEGQAAGVWMRMEQLPGRGARATLVRETIGQAIEGVSGARVAATPQMRRPDPRAARSRSTTTRGRPAPKNSPDAPPGTGGGPHQAPPERRRGRGR